MLNNEAASSGLEKLTTGGAKYRDWCEISSLDAGSRPVWVTSETWSNDRVLKPFRCKSRGETGGITHYGLIEDWRVKYVTQLKE